MHIPLPALPFLRHTTAHRPRRSNPARTTSARPQQESPLLEARRSATAPTVREKFPINDQATGRFCPPRQRLPGAAPLFARACSFSLGPFFRLFGTPAPVYICFRDRALVTAVRQFRQADSRTCRRAVSL